jgi:membrane-bound ClpP family serine protease
MQIPQAPANLTAEQVTELNQKLSHMRHEINNQLSLVVAALELIRFKPDARDKMLNTISEQPNKIIAEMQKFSTEFEKTFGIKRD